MLIISRKHGDTHWTASCDDCKALFLHRGNHSVVKVGFPDKLADLLRRRGWKTERHREPGAPLKWVCPDCQERKRQSA